MGIKYLVNENFFKKWTHEMAYVLGYIYADGSLDNSPRIRAKYFSINSVDEDTIRNIREVLGSGHTVVRLAPTSENRKEKFLLRIGSHAMYDDLEKLGLYPNKSLTMSFPKIPQDFLSDFVRGYFDGDGCAYLEMSEGISQERIIKRLRTIFTSGSRGFLEGLQEVIACKTDCVGKIYVSHRAFQLVYGTKESMEVFVFLYGNARRQLFLKRKFEVFLKYFRMRKKPIDKEVEKMVKWVDYGHVVK